MPFVRSPPSRPSSSFSRKNGGVALPFDDDDDAEEDDFPVPLSDADTENEPPAGPEPPTSKPLPPPLAPQHHRQHHRQHQHQNQNQQHHQQPQSRSRGGGRQPQQRSLEQLTTRIWELEGEVAGVTRRAERERAEREAAEAKATEAEARVSPLERSLAEATKRAEIAEARASLLERANEEQVQRSAAFESETRETVARLESRLAVALNKAEAEMSETKRENGALRVELERAQDELLATRRSIPSVPAPTLSVAPVVVAASNATALPIQASTIVPATATASAPTTLGEALRQLQERCQRLERQNESFRATLWKEREERAAEAKARDVELELAQQRADEAVARALNVARLVPAVMSTMKRGEGPRTALVANPGKGGKCEVEPAPKTGNRRVWMPPSFAKPTVSSLARNSPP